MLTVYGFPRSRATRILWMLEELQQDYDYQPLDLEKGEHRSAEFLALNPAGKVPVLIDDDLILSECTAIISYLGDKFEHRELLPTPGSAQRALHDQWASFVVTELEQPLWTMGKHKFAIPKEYRVKAIFPTATWELQQAITLFSDALGDNPFILGDSFTAADILLGHTLFWAKGFEQPIEQANLQQYMGRVSQRPSLQKALAREKSSVLS